MTTLHIREQLHKQIDSLPDDIVEQIADFTLFVVARRRTGAAYSEWDASQWQEFALEHLFREEDEVDYSLEGDRARLNRCAKQELYSLGRSLADKAAHTGMDEAKLSESLEEDRKAVNRDLFGA